MSKDLKRYNHLTQENQSANSSEDFIDFLFANSTIDAPEVNENDAWEHVVGSIERKKRGYYGWMKIAASIAIVCSIALALYVSSTAAPERLVVTTGDQTKQVGFPDGSIGVLNEHSTFSFLSEFGGERRVSFEGEAYFDVKKSTKPFIIEMNGVEVKVLGTAFNLTTSDNDVTLYVDRGLVAFSKNGIDTHIKAGLEATFDRNTSEVVIKEIPTANIMSWRSGFFKFDETPLKQALVDLGEYYDVDFKLANTKLGACRISATIDQKSLTEVVRILETILDVKVDVKNKYVKISGQGC